MSGRTPSFLIVALLSGLIAGTVNLFNDQVFSLAPEPVQPIFSGSAPKVEMPDQEPHSLLLRIKGPWRFSIGDQRAWASPEFDDRAWQEIECGKPWEDQGLEEYDGFAWYRKRIFVARLEEPVLLKLNLGQIDDADEVYLNGRLVGATGSMPPDYSTGYHHKREYIIAPDQVEWGSYNTLAIRVYDAGGEGGLLSEKMTLYTTLPRPVPDLDLSGTWEFVPESELNQYGENAAWKRITVPGTWEKQGWSDLDGFAWYRKTVTLNRDLANEPLVLLLGKIDDLDAVYIDGKLVASTGEMNQEDIHITGQEWEALRGYYLPNGLVKANQPHEIAVRVYDHGQDGGIYEGPIGLITQEHYIDFWKKHRKRLE